MKKWQDGLLPLPGLYGPWVQGRELGHTQDVQLTAPEPRASLMGLAFKIIFLGVRLLFQDWYVYVRLTYIS